MGHFSDALAGLAALAVDGVTVSYAAADVPSEVDAAVLPALLVLPTERAGRLFGGRGDGFGMLTLGETGAVYTAEITHLLLVSPEGRGVTPRSALATVAEVVDGYFAALRSDARLGGTLKYPPQVQVDIGLVTHGARRYLGATFRHVWTIGI